MELIDILDKEGNKTGAIETKKTVHRLGLRHRSVHIWILNQQNEILLQYRSENMENYPNMWDISVAGHVSSGETSKQAALREIEEEISLKLTESDLEFIATVQQYVVLNNATYFDHTFNDIYIVRLDYTPEKLKAQEEEIKALQWFKVDQLKTFITEKRSDIVPHEKEFKILFNEI